MAVVPMSRVWIYGLNKYRKAVLEAVQRFGILEIKAVEEDGLSRVDTASMRGTFLKAADTAQNALSVLDSYAPEKSSLFDMFSGKREIGTEEYYKYVAEIDEIMRIAGRVCQLSKGISESKVEIAKITSQIESLSPWELLDIPLDFKGTKKTACFTGSISGSWSTEQLIERIGISDVEISVASSAPEQTYFVAICKKTDAAELDGRLRELGFVKPVYVPTGTPREAIARLYEALSENEKKSVSKAEEIKSFAGFRNSFKFAVDYYSMRSEKYEALGSAGLSKKTFVLSGYIPEDKGEKFAAALEEKYRVAVELEPAGDDAPVLLKNNGFASPVEGVVESFGMPGRDDCDPSAIMAIFYYLLFGIMLADFGYGVIMALLCFIAVKKFPMMDKGLKRSLKMFGYCGISTAFWGLMFGGCFGDAVTVISTTFFGKTVDFPALLFAPLDNIMAMLVLSFGIGIAHLFVGLFIKLWQNIKQGAVLDGIYDVVFWYFLVGGLIAVLLSTSIASDMFGITPLPPIAKTIGTVLAIVGALGIVVFAGRSSKSPFKRLAKGLYELYGVTSYLSDILSYSRLLALGLASGVIAQVFNKMGSMAGGGVLGVILFTAVFIVGHTLNIGINLLGAYVHTNRLQFVEFFGKFYEGGGRAYEPFSEDTKYFYVREDV